MDENGEEKETAKDKGKRTLEEVEEVEQVVQKRSSVIQDTAKGKEDEDEGPGWSRYDKATWIPKPIGVV
jgi:hypothetical protein